jgi:hypothetical protein
MNKKRHQLSEGWEYKVGKGINLKRALRDTYTLEYFVNGNARKGISGKF